MSTPAQVRPSLIGHLTELRLPTVRQCYEETARRAESQTLSYEQYLLEALLTGNPGYTVRLAACQLLVERWDDVRALFGEGLSGASLWLEKTGA